MAINITNLGAPSNSKGPTAPALPNLKDQKKKVDEFKKDQKEIHKIKQDMDKTINEINKSMESLGKSAKQIVLLRLDMVADKLEHYNSRLASQVDAVADAVEKSLWEN